MARWVGAVAVAVGLMACGSTSPDESAGWSAEKLYAEAKAELASGAYEKAATLFERLEGRAVGTAMSQQAQLERAYALYKGGEKAQALTALERFIRYNPTSPGLDYALYLQGVINFNDDLGILGNISSQDMSERDQQASRDAYQAFRQLVERFPESRYAPDAKLRMNFIVNTLAAYEVHVARYYYRRGAYLAAANRAQQAVREFQQSPSSEEALSIMVRSYDRLGLAPLRDDAQRVLRSNFPNSPFLTGQDTTSRRSWWRLW